MTLYLLILEWAGVDAPLDASDYVSWAKQKLPDKIQNGLTSAGTSNHFFVHRDAERQRDKAGTRVTLEIPHHHPFLDSLLNSSSASCPDSVFLFSGHIIFLTSFQFLQAPGSGSGLVLETFLEEPHHLCLANFSLSSKLIVTMSGKSFPQTRSGFCSRPESL